MRICCVCTGNTCRSPMLAALLRRALAGSGHEVLSAGVAARPGQPASPHARTCMAARGLDLADHRSRGLDAGLLAGCDCFLCLTPGHAQALQELGVDPARTTVVDQADGGVPDPYGGDLACYEVCARKLAAFVEVFSHSIAG
jgi:protein-tyrosine-phosphatase